MRRVILLVAFLAFSFASNPLYTIPLVDDDFNWRLILLDPLGVDYSYISDAVPPSGTFASTSLGQLSIILNGQFPQMFLTIQRLDQGQTYLGATTCTYVDTCFVAHSVIRLTCTNVTWTLSPGQTFDITGINTQPFVNCTQPAVPLIPPVPNTVLPANTYVVPVVDDDFNWRIMALDVSGQTNSKISDAVTPSGTFGWTPLGQLSVILNGNFPQMFLTVQRLDQGQTYLTQLTCNYVDTCLSTHTVFEVSCNPANWTLTPGQSFFISGNNTQPFVGCIPGTLVPTPSNATLPPDTYTVPIIDDDFNWRLMALDFSGKTNSRVSDFTLPTGTFGWTPYGQISLQLCGQFPQLFLTVQRYDQGQTYVAQITCTYVDTCYIQGSVLEMNCAAVNWTGTLSPGQIFYISGNNTQQFIGCASKYTPPLTSALTATAPTVTSTTTKANVAEHQLIINLYLLVILIILVIYS